MGDITSSLHRDRLPPSAFATMTALSTTMLGKLGSTLKGGTKVLKKTPAPAKQTKSGFSLPSLPKTQKKTVAPKKKTVATPKKSTVKKGTVSSGTRSGGVGYRKFEGRPLW